MLQSNRLYGEVLGAYHEIGQGKKIGAVAPTLFGAIQIAC